MLVFKSEKKLDVR